MRTRTTRLLLVMTLSLAACASPQTTYLHYPGYSSTTIKPLEAAIQKRGYKPACEVGAYCKFQYSPQVWIHFNAQQTGDMELFIDVVDGAKMTEDQRKALTNPAMKVGISIWNEASADAQEHERAARAAADADAQARKAARDEWDLAAKNEDLKQRAAQKEAAKKKAADANAGGSTGGSTSGSTSGAGAASGGLSGGVNLKATIGPPPR